MTMSSTTDNKYFVYILKCSDNSFYTGITNDLENRLKTHNAGKASKYTRGRLPVEYIYIEEVKNKSQALKREIKIKSFDKNKKVKLIKNKRNLLADN